MDRRSAAAGLAATPCDVARSRQFYHINSISDRQPRGNLMRNRMILACTTSALGLIAMPSAALAQDQGAQVTVESAPDDPAADDAIVVPAIQRSLATSPVLNHDNSEEHR